jgi:hypothetical protein
MHSHNLQKIINLVTVKDRGIYTPTFVTYFGYAPTYPQYPLDIPVSESFPDVGVYKLFTTR